jgi:hypothetical protein
MAGILRAAAYLDRPSAFADWAAVELARTETAGAGDVSTQPGGNGYFVAVVVCADPKIDQQLSSLGRVTAWPASGESGND